MIHEIALTIKPTMQCNMKCRHCFNGDVLKFPGIISIDKVLWFIEAACKKYQDVKITFHGGEPTLAGFDFYQKVFSFQNSMKKEYGVSFSNNFTTNAVLLTDKLIDLLINNNALINISFDGPYNDYLRENSQLVFQRIRSVQNKGGRVRAFCTISQGSYKHLLDIYKWFNEREIDFKIAPIEPHGYAAVHRELLMDPDDFIRVLTETYRYWTADKNCRIHFGTFEEFACLRRGCQFKPFWFNREIALNPDGKIYPFGRPNDIQFCLGESNDSLCLDDCFASPEYTKMLNILENYRKNFCIQCSSLTTCNGVCICMYYMYVQNEELLRYSCNLSNKIFDNILLINDAIISDIANGNAEKYSAIIQDKFSTKAKNI